MDSKCKTVSIAAIAAAVAVFNFQSCKKYEDGPVISLKTKKSRLTGEWELEDIKGLNLGNVEIIFEFEKDGDFEMTYSYSYGTYSYSYSYKGDWEWVDNKEAVEIDFRPNGDLSEWEILRLKNKELTLEDEYGNEWEFEKQ